MPIFNSLGSNYSPQFVWAALKQWRSPDLTAPARLKEKLQTMFGGDVQLFYKGRDAIEATLRMTGVGEGDSVITQAFTCFAIEEAIVRAGAQPVYVDITKQSWQPSVTALEQARQEAVRPRAVIIQHTLGLPAPMAEIKTWAHQHNLLVIEDLASAIGGEAADGQPLGSFGDAVILSFGRDKVVDAISGGALLTRSQKMEKKRVPKLAVVPASVVARDLWYPWLTRMVRKLHTVFLGKILFVIGRQVGWISSPIVSPLPNMATMPASHAFLVLLQLESMAENVAHRQLIASIYEQHVPMSATLIGKSAYVRYSITVPYPQELVRKLKKMGVHVADRWYRRAVDCGSLKCATYYQTGSCPVAEELAEHVFNLPTHREVTPSGARQIAQVVEQYIKSYE